MCIAAWGSVTALPFIALFIQTIMAYELITDKLIIGGKSLFNGAFIINCESNTRQCH
jgi:hypothetical protein